jgi:hypothetical protein
MQKFGYSLSSNKMLVFLLISTNKSAPCISSAKYFPVKSSIEKFLVPLEFRELIAGNFPDKLRCQARMRLPGQMLKFQQKSATSAHVQMVRNFAV